MKNILKKYCERFPDEIERLAPLLKQLADDSDSRLLSKLASASEVQGVYGAQKSEHIDICEALSTGATQQFTAEVEFGKKSITDRKTLPGHVTGSALVIDGEKILLIFHPFLKKWIQPGGHIDVGETPLEAAQRELLEETGVTAGLHSWHKKEIIPFDIDIHLIPANEKKDEPGHLHYDFRFLFSVDKNATIQHHEEHASRWVKFHEAEELQVLIEKIKKYRVE